MTIKISRIGLTLLCLGFVSPAIAQYDRAQSGGDFPLPITLSSFAASGSQNAVLLRWVTQSEVDLVGFNLYRSLGQQGQYSRINPILIPALGGGSEMQAYQYSDAGVITGYHYYYKVSSLDVSGQETLHEPAILGIAGYFQENSWAAPPDFSQIANLRLQGNYPEPFNGETTITFSVFEFSQVHLEIFTVVGKKLTTLFAGALPPGEYQQIFTDDRLPSGVYLYRLTGDRGFNTVRKMVLLR